MSRTRKKTTFDFTYEGKSYVIKQNYEATPAKIVLNDGKVLDVRIWNLIPLQPVPDTIEAFDPQQQNPAEFAQTIGGILAELQS